MEWLGALPDSAGLMGTEKGDVEAGQVDVEAGMALLSLVLPAATCPFLCYAAYSGQALSSKCREGSVLAAVPSARNRYGGAPAGRQMVADKKGAPRKTDLQQETSRTTGFARRGSDYDESRPGTRDAARNQVSKAKGEKADPRDGSPAKPRTTGTTRP